MGYYRNELQIIRHADISQASFVQTFTCLFKGIPDLLLTFADTKFLQDCSFHQCVRYDKIESPYLKADHHHYARLQRWSRDKMLSFVPPDGRFVLMGYRYAPIPSSGAVSARHIPVPVSLLPTIKMEENGGTDIPSGVACNLLNSYRIIRFHSNIKIIYPSHRTTNG